MSKQPCPIVGVPACAVLIDGRPSHRVGAKYISSLVDGAGCLPLLVPAMGEVACFKTLLDRLDGLFLTGAGSNVEPHLYDGESSRKGTQHDPDRDATTLPLIRLAVEHGVPLFAVCRGIQVLNVAYGGTLIQDIPSQIKGAIKHEQKALRHDALGHAVTIEAGTKLAEIAGGTKMRVNSFHHQSVDRVADGFQVTARSADGVIEAIEDPSHPYCVGVQWHPERLQAEESTRRLFSSFIGAARTAAQAGTRAARE